ncbi:MAG: PorV/PorQ family protein [Fibrobacter sp.]|nr:PorV/PorQ family protein [Fibrobacter sp.]
MKETLSYTKFKPWLLLVVVSLVCAYQGPGHGFFEFSDEKAGTAALAFLQLPAGTAPAAMGGFGGANLSGPTALFWNPAQIVFRDGFRADFTHSELYNQYRHESVAAVFPMERGHLGASFAGLFAKKFEGARDIEENDYDPPAMDFALGITWAQALWSERLWAGATLNWLHSQLDDVHGDGYALDLGVVGNMPWGHKVSLSLRNLSHGFKYRTHTSATEKLPTTLRLGWALADTLLPWAYSLGYSKSNDGLQRLHYGVEWNWQRTLFLRMGYEQDLHKSELGPWRGLSGGLGLTLNTLSLEYSLRSGGHLGLVHLVGVKVHPAMIYKEKIDHLGSAQKAFRHGSCTDVKRHAQRALKEDPGNLTALSLLQECAKEAEVMQGNYVAIAFSANSESQIAPFYRENELVGGLSRRKTVVNNLRSQFPHLLLVDAGEIHAEYAEDDSRQRMHELYECFDYDALALDLSSESNLHKFPYVSTYPQSKSVPKNRILKAGKHKVGVLSINGKDRTQSEINEALLQAQEMWDSSIKLQVVLFNGNLNQARQLAQSTHAVDLIVLSGREAVLMPPLMEGKTRIMCPGRRGEAVGLAVLWLRDDGEEWETRIFAVDSRLQPDSLLAQVLGENSVEIARENSRVVGLDSAGFLFLEEVSANKRDIWHFSHEKQARRLTRSPQNFVDVQQAFSRQSFVSIVDSAGQESLWWQAFDDKNPRKIFDRAQVLNVLWEPHENWVYFSAQDSSGNRDLWRCTWQGAHTMNLSQGKQQIKEFRFDPSGNFLAYSADSAGRHAIYHSDYNLLAPVRISADSMDAFAPRYDKSGQRLAFLVGDEKNGGDIWIWHRSDDILERITVDRQVMHFEWGGDDSSFLINSGINIYDSFVLNIEDFSEKPLLSAQREDISETARPRPQILQGNKGIIMEYRHKNVHKIKWLQDNGSLEDVLPSKESVYLPPAHGR